MAPTPDNPNPPPADETYFDGTPYKVITFWVRGEKGDENFVVGLSDRHWDRIGDSVKSQEIGKYLPEGKITTLWQKATIDRKSTRLNSSHSRASRMPSSA